MTHEAAAPPHAPASAPAASKGSVEVHRLPPRWEPTPVTPSLPIGVAVLAIAIALGGVVILLAGALFLLNAYLGTVVPSSLLIVRSVDPLGAAILVLLGAILLSVATALWRQEAWALWTTIVVVFVALAYMFFTASITVIFLLFLVLFIYLLTVRHHFY
ncbi:MAG: hypothetical protein L3K06_08925 [Thermoplasmata archaeon]|nr:hypothetical protein [Thermoplasmata archaeon]